MKHLIIPDPHAHPEYDNYRFLALGRFIMEERPDVIICLGDMADMPSLSSYDKGKKNFEGRRYMKDIAAVDEANRMLFEPLRRHNKMRRRNRKKVYNPTKIMTLGNHEERIKRVSQNSPELDGVVSLDDLNYHEWGWICVGYNDHISIDGIAYSHHFATGVSGRPISGENIGRMLVQKNLMSSVQGHSHVFDHSIRTKIDGTRVHGMSVGCFTHPNYVEGWNEATHHMWWRGVVVLEDVEDGDFSQMTAVGLDNLLTNYL